MARIVAAPQTAENPQVTRLLGLLLVDALETIAHGRSAAGSREARQWMCSPSNGAYSFEHACDAFGLPPDALRRRLGLRAQSARRRSSRGWMRPPNR
jgi:hypothetical protein